MCCSAAAARVHVRHTGREQRPDLSLGPTTLAQMSRGIPLLTVKKWQIKESNAFRFPRILIE